MYDKSVLTQTDADALHNEAATTCAIDTAGLTTLRDEARGSYDGLNASIVATDATLRSAQTAASDAELAQRQAVALLATKRHERTNQVTANADAERDARAAIAACKRAIQLMQAGSTDATAGGSLFLQRWTPSVSFDFAASPSAGDYAADADGLLKGLLSDFEGELTALAATASDASVQFSMAQTALTDAEKTASRTLTHAREAAVQAKAAKAQLEVDILAGKNALAGAESALAARSGSCNRAAADYASETTARTAEQDAMAQAIATVAGLAEATGTAVGTNLLQQGNPTDAVSLIVTPVRAAARALRSSRLGALVSKISRVLQTPTPAAQDPLAKVKLMISALIKKLLTEASEEETRHSFCKSSTEAAKIAIESSANRLANATAENETAKSSLSSETAREAELQAEVTRIAAVRDADALAFQQRSTARATDLTGSRDAVAALDEALASLRSLPGLTGTQWRTSGQTVLSLVDIIRDDFANEVTRLETEQKDDSKKSAEVQGELDASLATLIEDHKFSASQVNELTDETVPAASAKETSAQQEHDAAKAQLEALREPCTFGETPAERKARRSAEVQSLHDALTMVNELAGTRAPVVLSQTSATQTPTAETFDRMLKLLSDLKTRVNADVAADKAVHDKGTAWCADETARLLRLIELENGGDAQLVAAIEAKAAAVARLEVDISNMQKELAQHQHALQTMSSLREREATDFQSEEISLRDSIGALKAALVVLSKKATTGTTTVSALALLPHPLQSQARAQLSMTSTGSRVTAAHQAKSPGSDEVRGVLTDMLATFEANLEAEIAGEAKKVSEFAGLKHAKQASVVGAQDGIASRQQELALSSVELRAAKDELKSLRESGKNSREALALAQTQCDSMQNDYMVRSDMHVRELAALADAITRVEAGKAAALATAISSTTIATTTPVALHASAPAATTSAAPVTAAAATAVPSAARFASMFKHLSASGAKPVSMSSPSTFVQIASHAALPPGLAGGLDTVIAHVDRMVTTVRAQAKAHSDARDECESEAHRIATSTADANSTLRRTTGLQQRLASQLADAEGIASEANASVGQLQAERTAAEARRASQLAAHGELVKSNEELLSMVRSVVQLLASVYPETAVAAGDDFSLAQQTPEATSSMEPSGPGKFTTRSESRRSEGASILGLLRGVEDATVHTLEQVIKTETAAADDHQRELTALASAVAYQEDVLRQIGEARAGGAQRTVVLQQQVADIKDRILALDEEELARAQYCQPVVASFESTQADLSALAERLINAHAILETFRHSGPTTLN